MSDRIAVTHRGYEIVYGDNSGEWACYDLEVRAPQLSGVRDKIDALLLKERKKVGVACLSVGSYGSFEPKPGTVIEYRKPDLDRDYKTGRTRITGPTIAAMVTRDGNDRPTRREGYLSDFAPLGPATDVAVAEARRLGGLAKVAARDFERAIKAIPRLTLEDIAELVKISGVDPTAGGLPNKDESK